MMNRRAFLKTLAAGAVAAVVPLPTQEPFAVTGTITAYFRNPELYKYYLGMECSFGEHPTNKREISNQQKVWESRNYPVGELFPYPNMWPGGRGSGSKTHLVRIRCSTGPDGPGVNWVNRQMDSSQQS